MLSPLKANHLVSCLPRLSLSCARNFATTSRRRDGPLKSVGVTPEEASDTLPSPAATANVPSASLNRYFGLPPLPPTEDWLAHFIFGTNQIRDRISIRHPVSAISVAHSFINSKKTFTGKPKVIVEAFPGPGALSRAFLTLPSSQLRRLIILEDHEPYLEYLRPLAQADPRVRIVPRNGFTWETYSYLLESGDLDVDIAPWENLHPELHFVSHIPLTVLGEQLVAQLFRCIPERSWLFKHGRIPMSFVLSDWLWRRISAEPQGTERCKLSSLAVSRPLSSSNNTGVAGHNSRPENRRRGSPFLAVNVVPHDEQVIEKGKLDQWDYILRRLFVLKSTPLRKAISSLAPGAEVLLKSLTDKTLPPEQRSMFA
ncbi:S-adenosyl-L-methionine-dependent methyltransferase [Russula vinacea]|nr:S-adenosyl-L-methionine-dependent methyltransferase [Russula vinacea]